MRRLRRRRARALRWVALAGWAALAGCAASQPAAAVGAAGATAPVLVPAPPPPAAPAPVPPPAAPPPAALGCRIMSSSGAAQRGSGESVRAGERVNGADWLELGKGASLHLKHGVSGREWTLRGPARVLPCVDGQEELIVAEGKLRTELGAGVRPGAQVLIGTPFGSLRYADASADLDVTRDALRLTVNAGDTWLRSTSLPPSSETHTTRAQSARRGPRERLSAERALTACQKAARDSEALAQALRTPGHSGLGKLAAEHVRARELAHASCAAATAAVLQQNTGEERSARLSELSGYRQLWQRVPPAGG